MRAGGGGPIHRIRIGSASAAPQPAPRGTDVAAPLGTATLLSQLGDCWSSAMATPASASTKGTRLRCSAPIESETFVTPVSRSLHDGATVRLEASRDA